MNEELEIIKCDKINTSFPWSLQSMYGTDENINYQLYVRKEHFKYLTQVKNIDNLWNFIKPFLHNPNGPAVIYEKVERKYHVPYGQLIQTPHAISNSVSSTLSGGLLGSPGSYFVLRQSNLPQTALQPQLGQQKTLTVQPSLKETIMEYWLDGILYTNIQKFNENARRYLHNLEFKKNLEELIND